MINKEQVYDDQIAPLMAQILTTCRKHKIAMVASFDIPTEENPDLRCTSALTMPEYEPPVEFREAVVLLYEGRRCPSVMAMTVSTP